MKKSDVLSAPRVGRPLAGETKWKEERRAFLRLRPSLLRSHRSRFVAIHQSKVVDSGEDKVALGLRVYAKFGYVPIYFGRVAEKPHTLLGRDILNRHHFVLDGPGLVLEMS